MSIYIACINAKGGAGKTTTAMYLAQAATNLGKSAIVRDLDPQGTATDWEFFAKEAGKPLKFEVNPAKILSVGSDTQSEFVIIDTPTADTNDLIYKLAPITDYIVIPTAPSPAEIRRTLDAAEVIKQQQGTKYGALMIRVKKGVTLLQEAINSLNETGTHLLKTQIPEREQIKKSTGQAIKNLYGYDKVLAEILTEIGDTNND